jgi:hypothetical protein
MTIDRYTKTILTLIMLFLAFLSAEKMYNVAVPPAEAHTPVGGPGSYQMSCDDGSCYVLNTQTGQPAARLFKRNFK